MIWIGVDPGKRGAIAMIEGPWRGPPFEVRVVPMPVVTATKGRPEYDLRGILGVIDEFIGDGFGGDAFVTVERTQTLPRSMGGALANFHRGVARGWEWLLAAKHIPYQIVRPQEWQRAMLLGTPGTDTKQRAILAAQRLFPDVSLRRTERSRKLDDGMADALLLAEFGRRTYGAEA